MNDTAVRQHLLAKRIGKEFCDYDKLIPLGRHSSFGTSLITLNSWYDQRICDLAWWAVSKQIEIHADHAHIIDHAWLVGFDAQPNEPWALVTEPYIAQDKAKAIAHLANDAMAHWDVRVHLLSPTESSWNPASCTPIVATFEKGCVGTFMRAAVTWALEHLQ